MSSEETTGTAVPPDIVAGAVQLHDFQLDSDGEVDLSAWDGDRHCGPKCLRCGDLWCHNCEPDRLGEECEGPDLTTRVTVSVSWPGKGERYSDRKVLSAETKLTAGVLGSWILDPVECALRELPQQVLMEWWRRDDTPSVPRPQVPSSPEELERYP